MQIRKYSARVFLSDCFIWLSDAALWSKHDNMLEKINNFIGSSDSRTYAQFYTNLFYSCFSDTFNGAFPQSKNAFQLHNVNKAGGVEISVAVASTSDYGLPDRVQADIFYDLLEIAGGSRLTANIPRTIQFKILPENLFKVDRWFSDFSAISIDINIESRLDTDGAITEKLSVKDLKLVESYKIENVSAAQTAGGLLINTSSKHPALFTVVVSDWILEAVSKNYFQINVINVATCTYRRTGLHLSSLSAHFV